MGSSVLAYRTPDCLFLAISLILKKVKLQLILSIILFVFTDHLPICTRPQVRGVDQTVLTKTVGFHRRPRCLSGTANVRGLEDTEEIGPQAARTGSWRSALSSRLRSGGGKLFIKVRDGCSWSC